MSELHRSPRQHHAHATCIVLLAALVQTLFAEGISSWEIKDRFSYDREEKADDVRVYFDGGRIVGLEPSPIPVIEKVHVTLPDRSRVTRAYYGYSPEDGGRQTIFWECSPQEVALIYDLIAEFSFRSSADRLLYSVTEEGRLQSDGSHVERIGNHLCSLGFYLFQDDGSALYIDGHPDSPYFLLREPTFTAFRNPTLNAILEMKMKEKKKGEPGATDNPGGAQ